MDLMHYLYALLSGFLSGGALGMTGGGGSILAVPLLVYVVGENVHLAIGTSLIAVGITSLISSVSYMKQSLVKFKVAFLMASPGIVSTYLGAWINKEIKGPVLLLIFSMLMLYIGYLMLKQKTRQPTARTGKGINYPKILTLGFITGFASGFFGIGGGFLLVPALYLGARLSMKESVATSLFIIFLFGIFGLASYEMQGRPIDWGISTIFVAGGAAGGILGAFIAKRTNQNNLRKVFSVFIMLIGVAVMVTNLIKLL
jgi:uncharacterized membrane protein YfcA